MEDRKLDAAESLALIGRMIENTRSRMVRNAGRPFLAWGYATAATLIAVWAAVSCTGDVRWNYLWFMLPLLGGALMYFTRPKAAEGSVHTYVDRVLDLIWSVIGPATLLISTLAICFVVRFPVAFTVLLMIGLGTTINNLIIGFKPGVAGGIAGIVLASVSLVVTGNWHAGLFLAAFVLMTIIPGHILNYRYRHSRSDVRQAAGPRPGKATKDNSAEEDGAATENGTAEDGAATDSTAADGAATGSAAADNTAADNTAADNTAADNTAADRPLNAAENIALVGRMIDNTRSRMVRNAGRPFLIWGYATVVTTLAVWAAYALFPGRNWYYLWLLLPVFGTALSLLTMPKSDDGRVYTFIDRVIGQVWLVMGLTAWFVSLLSVFGDMPVPILFVILLMMGIPAPQTGAIPAVGAIMGMAAAFEDACAHIDENAKKVSALRDRLIDGLSKIPHSALNGDPVNRLPGNVSFCFEGVEGESLLLLLDAKGICASSGSACTSGSLDPSHVLLAIGRPHDVARGSLRLSLCEWNTDEEIDRILDAVPEVVEYLRGMSPLWKDLVSGKKQFAL